MLVTLLVQIIPIRYRDKLKKKKVFLLALVKVQLLNVRALLNAESLFRTSYIKRWFYHLYIST